MRNAGGTFARPAARRLVGAAVATMIVGNICWAKDLDGISRFLVPAYTAMNFAMLCSTRSTTFLAEASGPRGTALHYAEHVKDEVIDGLNEDEAIRVLKSAADAARAKARQELYRLVGMSDDHITVEAAIRQWCTSDAKSFILEFMREHDVAHAEVIEFLRQAKQ